MAGDDKEREGPLSPAARDQAIVALQDHYAQNHLEVEDFERLVEIAERARTRGELAVVLHGLPALDAVAPVATPGRVTSTVSATLGSTTRRGRFHVPKHIVARARLGSVEMDLCDAELERGETLLEVSALLGSIEITVPEGLAVVCEGNAVLGSFDHVAQEAASRRDERVLRIVGRALLGSVEVKVKKRAGVLQGFKDVVRGLLGP